MFEPVDITVEYYSQGEEIDDHQSRGTFRKS